VREREREREREIDAHKRRHGQGGHPRENGLVCWRLALCACMCGHMPPPPPLSPLARCASCTERGGHLTEVISAPPEPAPVPVPVPVAKAAAMDPVPVPASVPVPVPKAVGPTAEQRVREMEAAWEAADNDAERLLATLETTHRLLAQARTPFPSPRTHAYREGERETHTHPCKYTHTYIHILSLFLRVHRVHALCVYVAPAHRQPSLRPML
jgi:hypothetical protein